jgi:hypothetical protein
LNQVNKKLVEEFELKNFEATQVENPTVIERASREKRKSPSSPKPKQPRAKRRIIIDDGDDESFSDDYGDSDEYSNNGLGNFIVSDSSDVEDTTTSTRSRRTIQKPTTFEAEFYPSLNQTTKKLVSASICIVPPYADDDFVGHHSTHCFKCKRSGSPNGPVQVKLGPEERRSRLLLCNTCSMSVHNNCASINASIDKKTGIMKCQKCVNALNCSGCNNDIVESNNNDTIPFRCSTCYRAYHYNCIASNVSSELVDEMKNTNLEDFYKAGVCLECRTYPPKVTERIAAERIVHDQLEYLIKWKDHSYRRTNWISATWVAHVNPSLYRGYLKRKEKVGAPRFSEDWKIIDRILDVEWINKSNNQARRVLAVFKDTEYGEGKYSNKCFISLY